MRRGSEKRVGGGTTMIPHSRPTVSVEDAERVARVVRSGRLAQGAEVEAFERELAARLGVAAVAAVSSGSAALELSLRALDVGHGDEVVVPTYACDALHHAVTRCGATPVLADADPETLGPAAKDVARRLTRRTRAVVVVHPFGLGLDLDEFLALGVPVVEDCAQAIGARVAGRSVGSRGAMAVCSFYATKLLTTGEGGAVAGAPERVARVRDARDYDEREGLVRKGVTARRPVFRPIHRALGLDGYPEADRLWTQCLSLPCYPSLADAEVEAVGAALAEALHA